MHICFCNCNITLNAVLTIRGVSALIWYGEPFGEIGARCSSLFFSGSFGCAVDWISAKKSIIEGILARESTDRNILACKREVYLTNFTHFLILCAQEEVLAMFQNVFLVC